MGRWASLAIVVLLFGCGRGAADEAKQKLVTQEAEERAREVTITSATWSADAGSAQDEAEDEALRARAEGMVALRREQLDYQAKLQRSLDELDDAVARRARLARDIAAIDGATEDDWPALRARIDRELGAPTARDARR